MLLIGICTFFISSISFLPCELSVVVFQSSFNHLIDRMTERSNIVGDINVNVPTGITQNTNGPPIGKLIIDIYQIQILSFITKLSVRTKQTYAELFQEFCTSSTVHGTYFWAAPGSKATKVIWGFIVFCGIGSAAIIINNSFKDWEKHPIMTNVCQAPVEEINMPSLTICPMNDNRYVIEPRIRN